VAHHPSGDAYLTVEQDSGIDRILGILDQITAFYDAGVAFEARQDVDALLFLLIPELVVDAGGIVDAEDFSPGGSTLPELGGGEAFEGADFMFFAPGDLVGEGEVAEGMGTQVEGIDVAGGEFGQSGFAAFAGFLEVMNCSVMGVTVSGVDVEENQRGISSEGVGHGAGEGGAEGGIGFGAEGKAAFAFEGRKEVRHSRQPQLANHGLEEFAPAADSFQGAADAHLQPIWIGELRAGAEGFDLGNQGEKRSKEMTVEGRRRLY